MDGAPAYAVSTGKQPVTQTELIEQYPQVFKEGIGCLEGEHHIWIDPQHTPVQHPPRKVLVHGTQRPSEVDSWRPGETRHTRFSNYPMGELRGSGPPKRWQIAYLFGSQRLKQSHSKRTIPPTHNWGNCNPLYGAKCFSMSEMDSSISRWMTTPPDSLHSTTHLVDTDGNACHLGSLQHPRYSCGRCMHESHSQWFHCCGIW